MKGKNQASGRQKSWGVKAETATFGAGCFWGVEAEFRKMKGVIDTAVGYSGGDVENPSYEDVCAGRTGHAEVVQVVYDPEKVSYRQLLDLFWDSHDPTTADRQGSDIGTNYCSVIFYHSEAQKNEAVRSMAALEGSGRFKSKIVTQVLPAKKFFRAEEYHQRYLEKRGLFTCHV